MNLFVWEKIIQKIKEYNKTYKLGNDYSLNAFVELNIDEEGKEFLLNELDIILPYKLIFSHIYENGKLRITFKEV